MRLFIAEKPSMGRELAACLGQPQKRHKDYIETPNGVVTWAYGHILRQWEPGEYDERYQRWQAQDLPIVPREWMLKPTEDAQQQFQLICRLMDQADEIVHAGDPDREGQLLIDEILGYVKNTKPVYRILLNALDEKSIHKALADLKDNRQFIPLRDSALARSRADWLMGMNLSRAYTLRARREGHQKVTFPIGRVKTPTLALVVRREREIENFTPQEYYLLKANFHAEGGDFVTKWKPQEEQVGLDSEGRLVQKYIGEEILKRLAQQPEGKVVELSRKKKQEPAPLPLSLSALQVLAGKRYGYEPQEVLDVAQNLYERKWTTYPRSDCDYLPENQWDDRHAILANLSSIVDDELQQMAAQADGSIRSRAWNDKKITAHHAIIPTTVPCPLASLNERERNIYRLIARAYVAQFYPVYQYEQTKVSVEAAEEIFTASGRVVLEAGWRVLYSKDVTEEKEETSASLPPLKKSEPVQFLGGELDEKTTKPPTRFTPATLLEAMKNIHRYVHDEKLKKQLRDVAGIGTEATRATIIAELTKRKFLQEKGKKKYLSPTEQAYLLIDALPEMLTYPDETAKWEERLAEMSHGEDSLQSFLADQTEYVTALVAMANDDLGSMLGEKEEKKAPICSKCGQAMQLRHGKYGAFWGCSAYPQCRHTMPAEQSREDRPPVGEPSEHICPRCRQGYFVRQGNEWVCSRFPVCRTRCADVEGLPATVRRGGKG